MAAFNADYRRRREAARAVGIEGRQIVSLDMARDEYAAAPTWQPGGATPLPADASIRDRDHVLALTAKLKREFTAVGGGFRNPSFHRGDP